MNFNWFHATQVEESDNHTLFFECKRCHFSIKNTTATRPCHKHSVGSTVLPLGLAQPKEQPRLLQQLSRFYLLPFPRKKLGYLTAWMPHIMVPQIYICLRFELQLHVSSPDSGNSANFVYSVLFKKIERSTSPVNLMFNVCHAKAGMSAYKHFLTWFELNQWHRCTIMPAITSE